MFPFFDVCYELTSFECMMIIFAMMIIIIGIFFIMGIVVLVKIARNLRETINENTDVLRLNATALLVVAEQNQIETAIISENTAVSLVAIIAGNTAATTGLGIVLTAANAIIDDNTDALLGVARNNPVIPVILPVVEEIFPADIGNNPRRRRGQPVKSNNPRPQQQPGQFGFPPQPMDRQR